MVKTLRSNADRYAATQRVTLTGAAVNIVLATAQLIGGVLTHSQGLIADGVHTVSDLASDFLVLLASRHAHREADIEHPYGHGRIETLATSILGLTLILVAGGILIDVVRRLQNPEQLLQPTPAALVFAALAVISKESLYQYTRRVAKRVRSSLLEANAWHHRSDAISSLIVIVGITGSLLGLKNFDAFAALVVAMFIGHIGWRVLWRSGKGIKVFQAQQAASDPYNNNE
jgi:cation diffusion facilitator family transporter